MSLSSRSVIARLLTPTIGLSLAGCGPEEVPYTPQPAPTVQANLPPVPNVPQKPIKSGDAYTVWGASYYLRSRVHHDEVDNETISVEGYIAKTNYTDAPECAVHKGGEADPEDCKAPIPTFWLAESKDAAESDAIPCMGWASNYAQLYDAIEEVDKKGFKEAEPMDTLWGNPIPVPLPSTGVKVRVTGRYSTTFTGSSTGTEADPIMGILTFQKIEYLEDPTELASLPGMKKRKSLEALKKLSER